MRNQPSNQSRDSRITQQSEHPSGSKYVSRQGSDDRRCGSRQSRRMETKTESYYEYVPSPRTSQRRYLARDTPGYEKPSLPYYVVPVLYVPQKVLSSEELRPSSALQNRNTMSFLLQNQQKEAREKGVIDVDKIPCIACETSEKIKKTDSERVENLMNDVTLDQPCTGYINTSYAQSSSSIIDDASYQDDATPDYGVRKFASPVYVQYEGKIYRETQPRRRCNPPIYQKYIQQQQNLAGSPNQVGVNQTPKANVRYRWNPECNCYEAVETTSGSINQVNSEDRDQNSQKVFVRPRKECSVPTNDVQNVRNCEYFNDLDVDERYCQPSHMRSTNCYDELRYECAAENYAMDPEKCDYDSGSAKVNYPDSSDYISCGELKNLQQNPTLTSGKPTRVVKKVSSLIGVAYSCEPAPNCQLQDPRPVCRRPTPVEVYTTEPIQNSLANAPVLSVVPKNRHPKQSQTTFDDVIIYSTYTASDVPIRDSKSTQTVDPATTTVTNSTQTNRAIRTFATCPPVYMNEVRENVGIMVRPRTRETSPSPTVRTFPLSKLLYTEKYTHFLFYSNSIIIEGCRLRSI